MPTYRVRLRRPNTRPPVWDFVETVVEHTAADAINSAYNDWIASNPLMPVPPLNQCGRDYYIISRNAVVKNKAGEIKTATQVAMDTFNDQWYNVLITGLKQAGLRVDENHFQVTQGPTTVGYDNSKIWSIFDSIPPVSLNHLFNPDQHNSLGTNYGGVINNLIPQNTDNLTQVLKSNYNKWLTYQKDANNWKDVPEDIKRKPDESLIYVFNKWALMHIDPNTRKAAVAVMMQEDIITVAMNQWVAANKQYAYTAGATTLTDAINEGAGDVTIEFDSKTASSDISNAWVKGNGSVEYDFFRGKASAQWDRYTEDIANNGLKMTISYDKVCLLIGGPYLNVLPDDPDLNDFLPWWNSSALKTAKENNNNKVWSHYAPTWEQTFGQNGNLNWIVVALIVADGITTTTTSKASINKEEYQNVREAVQTGYWPFFKGNGDGGWSSDITFKDDGTFTATSSSKEGNPQVIGVLVDSIDHVLGNSQ